MFHFVTFVNMSQHVVVQPRDAVPVNTHNLTLAHYRVSSSSVVEHPTRSWRVVGSNPIWGSDFFRVYVSPRIYVISNYFLFNLFLFLQKSAPPPSPSLCAVPVQQLETSNKSFGFDVSITKQEELTKPREM